MLNGKFTATSRDLLRGNTAREERLLARGKIMRARFKLLIAIPVALLAVSPSTAIAATVINFEEFAPDNTNGTIPASRYSYLGVTFQGTDDGSTFGGNGAGNPGNWGLEGTNGSTFSGFNGSSYSMTLLFDSVLSDFSLDAARSNGSTDGSVTLNAYLNGSSVGSTAASFGGINQWTTLNLIGAFDEVRIAGSGTGFHPFGIDNISFDAGQNAVPEPSTWAMMLLGFGFIGGAMRSAKRRQKLTVSYA